MKKTPLNKIGKKKLEQGTTYSTFNKPRAKIKPVSKKRVKIKKQEIKLSQELLEQSNGLCMNCGQLPDWRGLSKHEKVFRSQGGNPLDKDNTILICAKCHSEKHGIKEV